MGIVLLAAALRLVALGDVPGGLYRDEAYNGLDALAVLDGRHALFFPSNNGREPSYIYLTAVAIAVFGRTALAVRLPAALFGTLTTLFTYLLARSWFGRRVGLLAAFLWAVTLWPMHLSRIGFRAILLPGTLALAAWLATAAYRRERPWLWLLAGAAYGATFYTYLAARVTPVFLILFLSALTVLRGRRRLWPGLLWAAVGAAVVLAPLAALLVRQPELVFGRTGQVSIWNPAIHGGDLWGTAWRQIGATAGMFFWRGDTILRHNPAGRPVFDWLMVVPTVWGFVWCLRHWRRPAALGTLLWVGGLLPVTTLAEDAPHFLRSIGILPALLIFPAVGLSQLGSWSTLSRVSRNGLVACLLAGTVTLTVSDYFFRYARQDDVAYLFEAAARDLAESVNAEYAATDVYLDKRLWDGWPSLRFLTVAEQSVRRFDPESPEGVAAGSGPVVYLWPFAPRAVVAQLAAEHDRVAVREGPPARGDLEPQPQPLYVRYAFGSAACAADAPCAPSAGGAPATLDDQFRLLDSAVAVHSRRVRVELEWQRLQPGDRDLAFFVHVVEGERLLGQSDTSPGQGYWPLAWWRTGGVLHEQHVIDLPAPFDPARHTIHIGIYDRETQLRLPVRNAAGQTTGDTWTIRVGGEEE